MLSQTRTSQQAPWYRKAVAAADAGLPTRAFEILEANRAVLDVTIRDKHTDVAKAFCDRSGDGGTCLVVTQTNAEVDLLNEAIRKELIDRNLLGSPLLRLPALRPLDMTSAQKLQPQQYAGNTVIIANRKVAGLERNQACRFKHAQEDSIVVQDASGVEHVIRGNQLDRVTVCEEKELELRAGEQLQIKANLKTRQGVRLANGSIVRLEDIDPDTGDIQVKDRQDRVLTLDPAVRMLQYGYASTSYGSQGKTVDHVLISDSQCKAATNQKEFYVSISRGRQSVAIYTTDREALRDHVQRLGDRKLALDLDRAI